MIVRGLLSAERLGFLEAAGLGPAAVFKWAHTLSLVGDGASAPAASWSINWNATLAMEPRGWARFPRLSALGLSLLDRSLHREIRVAACRLLADVPSVEVAETLGRIVLDGDDDRDVRSACALALGMRQLGWRDDTLFIGGAAKDAADRALTLAVEQGLAGELPGLARALRHVASPALHEALEKVPVAVAASAVDACSTPGLARRLLGSLADVPSPLVPRIAGLVAHVLGAEAATPLLDFAARAPLTLRPECMFAALAVDPSRAAGPVRDWVRSMPMMRTWALRADFHEANPGVVPVTRALAVARRLAEIAPAERAAAASQAAADFQSIAAIEPFAEHELAELWWSVAWHAGPSDPDALIAAATPATLARQPALVPRLLDALARRGRARDVERTAVERSALADAVWTLARHGWPRRALRLGDRVSVPTVESVAGTTLALITLGRRDLAGRVLASGQPAVRPVDGGSGGSFPGVDELHRARFEPERLPLSTALVRRSMGALEALGASVVGDPDDVEPPSLARLEGTLALLETTPRYAREPLAMNVQPHRVTFLAPVLVLPKKHRPHQKAAAMLLHLAIAELFARDRRVAMKDATTFRIVGEDGELLVPSHPVAEATIVRELSASARHEVLWLELDATRSTTAQLCSRGPAPEVERFSGIGATMADAIGAAIGAWRAARNLGVGTSTLAPADAEGWLGAAAALHELLAKHPPEDTMGAADIDPPSAWPIPFLRALDHLRGYPAYRAILALDPENPWALVDRFLVEERKDNPEDVAPVVRVVTGAPHFRLAWVHLRAEGLDSNLTLDALAMAAALDPGEDDLVQRYGRALTEMGRHEAGHRMAARAARTAPHDFGHLVAALETTTDLVRPGYHLAQAEARIAEMNAGPLADWFHLGNPDVRFCYLSLANAHLYAGRLDEAIAERARVLEDSGGSWPNQTKVLVDWQTSTDILARCHAKEGFARGDLGRVLEGISLTRATTASEIAVSVRALLALGEPVLARLAFAHARPHGPRRHPAARLAGAEALMSCGELGAALSELFVVELRHPRQRYETQVHRTLRLGACLSLATWESEIQSLVDRGALRLGALAARHTADFVPGCAKSGVVLRALGAREAQDVPAAAIDALATALGVAKKAKTRLDRALDPGKESSLAAADAIATRFWDGLSKGAARDRELLYVATQALARYLVATTRAPSVLAGGYRQAAASAFEAIAARDPELDTGTLRAVLAALEEAGAGVDTWVFDAWILYVERALRIEDRVSGRLESLASGLSRVSASLRGDLAIGVELATAGRLEDSDPEAALALLERCVRAGCGSNVAFRAARAAEACRGPVDVLDRAWTALSSSPFAAAPAITVARRSFENGASDVAFAALCEHLSKGGATWREARVAELSEAWRASGLDVPLDFDEAQSAGLTALSSGDFEKARRCYAWCNALDPNNAVTLKNLGLVSTRLGKTADALAYFSQADAGAAPTWTAHELMASRKFAESMPAHRYAALGYDRAELFVYAAKSAWFAGDDEAKLAAVARARALDPASVDLTFLNGYADAAATFGDDEPCEEAARELLAKGAGNATWESLAHFHLATVLSRRGDFKQASRHAKDAARLNPLPDNAAEFADMVDRCKRKDPKKPTPKRADAPAAKAFACLLDDDAGAALALAGEATTGRLALARLTAARRRNEGEERVIVTDRALTAAREVVAATEGATTMEDASARVAALRILEDALGPVDPPPTLGKRMSREEFRKAYVARGGVDRRPAVLLP